MKVGDPFYLSRHGYLSRCHVKVGFDHHIRILVAQAVSLFVHTDEAALAARKNFKFQSQLKNRDAGNRHRLEHAGKRHRDAQVQEG